MKEPIVSVIVPNYNHEKYLRQRLNSIFEQTYENIEVILLDDSSTDKSKEILLKYADHPKVKRVIINDNNSGSTFYQWNKGIQIAEGDYVWIAESDDYCDNSFLHQMVESHLVNPDIALSFCQSYRVNDASEITGNWITHTAQFPKNIFGNDFVMNGNDFIEDYLIYKNVIPNVSAVLFKKKALDKLLPLSFKPYMKYYADWYFYIKVILNSRLLFSSQSLNYFRYHENSVIGKARYELNWSNIYRMELRGREEILKVIEEADPPNFTAIKKNSRVGKSELLYSMAKIYLRRKEYIETFICVFGRPYLMKKVLKYLLYLKRNP